MSYNQAWAIQINGTIDRTVILVLSNSHFFVLVKLSYHLWANFSI
jgi:hypothetical protein